MQYNSISKFISNNYRRLSSAGCNKFIADICDICAHSSIHMHDTVKFQEKTIYNYGRCVDNFKLRIVKFWNPVVAFISGFDGVHHCLSTKTTFRVTKIGGRP